MLCAVIKGPSFSCCQQQIQKAAVFADLLEFRIDLFDFWDIERFEFLKKSTQLMCIFTLRIVHQGGNYSKNSEQRLKSIEELASLQPAYLDIECDLPNSFFTKLKNQFPNVQLICSFHDFFRTPDLKEILKNITQKNADIYKIATMATQTLDSLRLLEFLKTHLGKEKVIALCMGDAGQMTRILAKSMHPLWTYVAIDPKMPTAPGQMDAASLLNIYRYAHLNSHTDWFGLIGDPVKQSIGDRLHNDLFGKLSINAVYVKMPLKKEELDAFFYYLKKLPFKGLSVTMPLKEVLFPYLDDYDNTESINTIVCRDGKLYGYNTDGKGALTALLKRTSLRGKKIAILGAGGAAKSIALELHRHQTDIAIYNRTPHNGQHLAAKISGQAFPLDQFPIKPYYDIIINCTPCGMGELSLAFPIHPNTQFSKDQIIMDIVSIPKQTPLIQLAKGRAEIIYGMEMFIYQAIEQYRYWFDSKIDFTPVTQELDSYFADA